MFKPRDPKELFRIQLRWLQSRTNDFLKLYPEKSKEKSPIDEEYLWSIL